MQTNTNPYQILYLNGPSSSGKSTLAKLLQEKSPHPFLHFGIDKMIELMPPRLNDWAGSGTPEGFGFHSTRDPSGHEMKELYVGPFGKKLASTFLAVAAVLAREGHFLIIDDVAIRATELQNWKVLFRNFRALYVGVTCSIEDLEQREKTRGDRMPGSARAQHQRIKYDNHYDLVLNTSEQSTEQCAETLLQRLEQPASTFGS